IAFFFLSLLPSIVSTPASTVTGTLILSIVFLLGFPGNLFVIWSILARARKQSVTTLLILNLALADGSLMALTPFFIAYLAFMNWKMGTVMCKVLFYLCLANMYASIYLIMLMSIYRLVSIVWPQRISVITVISSLPHSLFLCLFYSIIKMHIRNSSISICMPYHWGSMCHPVFQYLFETVMGCLVPFSLISTCYSSVICRLQSAKFQRRGQGSRLILLIIVTFAIFWLPYHVVNIIEVILLIARPNVTAFAYFSSAVNPILYVFAGSSHIRQAGLSFMGRLFEATNSESRTTSTIARSGRSGSSPDESAVLYSLSTKIGKPFKGKGKERSSSLAGKEANEPALKTLATVEQLE
uniref:Leukotriene B4 receptor 2a n=1 Tax=Xiphophorus couchianus TaxID=32473 RepID=A0A3B5L933_9TELE